MSRDLLEAPYARVCGYGVDVLIKLNDDSDRDILIQAVDMVIRRRDITRAAAAMGGRDE